MRRYLASQAKLYKFAIVALLFLFARAASAEVLKVVIDDTIQPLSQQRFERAIQEAEATHADALLIELRTPGGLMSSMEGIIQKLLAAKVPTIIYVTPAGSDASSAGFFILEAADVAAMAPGTNTGAAHPVWGGGQIMDPIMKEKVENYAASLLRSYTTKHGRNVEIAETAVRQSKSFTADEALSQHLIDFIAKDEQDLFRQLEGKTITRFDGSKVQLHLLGQGIRVQEMTLKQHTLAVLMNPSIAFIIFAIGMLAIFVEFNHPGAIIPGVVGFVCVLLSLYTLDFLPLRSIGLVLIIAAFAMFIAEAKIQSHGVIGIGGVILMVLGALLLVDGPIPQMRVQPWAALSVAIPMGLITVFLMSVALKARKNKVVTGEQGMVGEIGLVTAALAPAGKVFVQGALWDAVAAQNVEAGRRVVVRRVENLVLQVEPLHEPALQPTTVG
jgi:membrane-bound serine protease (ClpP class)